MNLLCFSNYQLQNKNNILSLCIKGLHPKTIRIKYLTTFLVAVFICSCCLVNPSNKLNYKYQSEQIELKVADYLSTEKLFTLNITLPPNEELGKATVSILMQKENKNKIYCHKLYSSNFLLKNRFKKASTFLIDNNYLFFKNKETPQIYHRGDYVSLFPSNLSKGRYKLQVVINNTETKIYSNIITIEYPLTYIN